MPPSKRIMREDIIKATLQVFRKKGFDGLNARSIAKELKCSTQPIYVEFSNMEELKEAIIQEAYAHHRTLVESAMKRENEEAYRAYGLGFVQFARDEKQMFRFLYLNAEDGGKLRDDMFKEQIIETIVRIYGYTKDVAEKFHDRMTIFTYGLAMLANTGYQKFSDDEIDEQLHTEFMALARIYGPPPNFAQKR